MLLGTLFLEQLKGIPENTGNLFQNITDKQVPFETVCVHLVVWFQFKSLNTRIL